MQAATSYIQNSDEEASQTFFIIGCILTMLAAGLNSLAGLGGGAAHLAILLSCFNIAPKDATIIVFACILGTSCGSTINQMRRAINGEALINYGYVSIAIPVMFMGSLIGVLANTLLPSVGAILIIITVSVMSLPKIFKRFREGYSRETYELAGHQEQNRKSGVLKESQINPFASQQNMIVFRQLLILVVCFALLSLMRGSNKFPSILGINSCSIIYWVLQLAMFGLAFYFYRSNMHLFRVWNAPTLLKGQELVEKDDKIEKNQKIIIMNSMGAGLLSGFGMGGGIFFIPMFRLLGLSPVQSSSSGAFAVFIGAIINVLQGLFLGILKPAEFMTFFLVSCFGSFCISYIVGKFLRKIHRTSLVELLLFLLLSASSIYLPISLIEKVEDHDWDWSIILTFGSIC